MEKENFSFDFLISVFEAQPVLKVGKKSIRIVSDECKAYMQKYFYVTKEGDHYFWEASKNDFKVYSQEKLEKIYLNRIPDELKHWYNKENRNIYELVSEINKPRVYDRCINKFYGFKYTNIKKYSEYPEEIRNGVNVFLKYMKEVLCSDNEAEYQHIYKWVAALCQGKKTKMCPYLKGPEGIGKSTFTEFLMDWVLGQNICTLGTTDNLITANNARLCGKLLVVFEELPTFTDSAWEGVSSKLKGYIDQSGGLQVYADKYEKAFEAVNINNYIINTNVDALKNSEGRRYFILHISTKYRQNYEYFGNIKDSCFNKEVGEAFYALMRETDIRKFNAQDMPMTQNKLNAIAERLSPEYKFMKQEYVFNKKDLNVIARDLYNEYATYCTTQQFKPLQYTKFTTKLSEVNIHFKKSNGVYKYNMNYKDLKAIADKYYWIHELDEFVDDEESIIPEIQDEKDKIIKDQKDEIALLKAEIAKLTKQLDPLEYGLDNEEEVIVIKPKAKTTIIAGETKTMDLDDVIEVDDILACFD